MYCPCGREKALANGLCASCYNLKQQDAAPHKGLQVDYLRVSALDQKELRQLNGLDLDKRFTDEVSGRDRNRPGLDRMIGFVREGDTLFCHSMDRLARNLDDLRLPVKTLTSKGVKVCFVKESLTFTGEDSPMANLLLSVMGIVAEFERELIKGRQREGLALAKKAGAYQGTKENLDGSAGCRSATEGFGWGVEDEAGEGTGRVEKHYLYVCGPGREVMRVLVDGLDTVIEGEVIGGELLDGVSGQYDLEAAFTVQCDDGACFLVHGWLVDVEIVDPPAQWVM